MERGSVEIKESWVQKLSQGRRRVLAVASLLGLPAMYAWSAFWLNTSAPKLFWGPVSFLLIGVTIAGGWLLYAFVRERADPGAALDERQRQLRDRAMVLAYQVLSGVVVLAVIYVGLRVLAFGSSVTLDATIVGGIVIISGVLVPLLPVAALAWVEPDRPAED